MSSRTWVCPPPDAVCRGPLENWITAPAAREEEMWGAVTPLLGRRQPGFPATEGRRPWPGAAMPRASPATEKQAGNGRQDLS